MRKNQYVHAGWLLDGRDGPARENMLLALANGSISEIVPYGPAIVGSDVEIIDWSTSTVLPPLVDAHLHLTMSGTTDPLLREKQLHAGCDELLPVIARHLDQLARCGVLTVRDGGDRDCCVPAYLASNGGDRQPVLVQSPGNGWHRQGRYGALIGTGVPEEQPLDKALAKAGTIPPLVKLVNSGLNSLKHHGRQTPPQFAAEELAMAVAIVHCSGGRVMVHANGERPVREAVEAGCDSIEHGFFMGRDNLARMADRGCAWVPTTCTMLAYAEILEEAGDLAGAGGARKNLDHQLEQLRLARELGVIVVVGTDAGSPGVFHGEAVSVELRLLLAAGFSVGEAVHAATIAGTRLMGLDQDRGLLAPGRAADFLVVRSSPAQLAANLARPAAVYLDGVPFI